MKNAAFCNSLRVLISTTVLLLQAASLHAQPDEVREAVRLSREYLELVDGTQKTRLAKQLSEHDVRWQQVIAELGSREHDDVKPGYYPQQHFSDPALREEHPDDLLYLVVPKEYQPDKPIGLVVFMHGGGSGSPRTAPGTYMTPGTTDEPQAGTPIGDVFESIGMIGVGPSAPWNEKDNSRWTVPEADEYIADVIRECKVRFHIDPDRVMLFGHSMGGFGAFHQVQRQPDRFAAVLCSAGSWRLACWPVIRGTAFGLLHGTKDAQRGVRARYTDIAYSRAAHQMLTRREIPHTIVEDSGGHSIGFHKKQIKQFFADSSDVRRNPYAAHIALASPVGYVSHKCFPVKHNRWLTLDAQTEGDIEFDEVRSSRKGVSQKSSEEDWNAWTLTQTTTKRPGALIEAVNEGGNRFRVTTNNVSRLTLWLHARMVDFGAPVRVNVDGKTRFEGRVSPSLVQALDSYHRRGDWRLVYPAKVTLDIAEPE
ncbi:MAG: hypothetical protein CMJ48_02565 [Planctomycetaceae bacterium]|nr:hypothetical protein [Planctomycetaceae bacterium]